SRVNFLVGIEEEHHEGEVVIELEEVQIEVVDARQADANELISQLFDLLQTDNLPVENVAIDSRHTAQDDHQGFAGLPRLCPALVEAEGPAVLEGILLAGSSLSLELTLRPRANQRQTPQSEKNDRATFHDRFTPRTMRQPIDCHGPPGPRRVQNREISEAAI